MLYHVIDAAAANPLALSDPTRIFFANQKGLENPGYNLKVGLFSYLGWHVQTIHAIF